MSADPVFYDAKQAGAIVHRSANWMQVNARKGKIPSSKLGRKRVWTPQHLAEIVRAGEQKPRPVLVAQPSARRKTGAVAEPVLRARTPRRTRAKASEDAA